MNKDYFEAHLPFDARREVVWKEIVRYLRQYIPRPSEVLEIGAGYCHFINNVQCTRGLYGKKVAIDISDVVLKYADSDVATMVTSVEDMPFMADTFDVVLASNLFEHLTDEQFRKTIAHVRRILRKDGTLIIIQPNFRYSFRDYFDDYTHVRCFTEIGLKEELSALGFDTVHMEPRFIPFSMAKALFSPPWWLIRLYLASPFRPKAGQMLLVCKKAGGK